MGSIPVAGANARSAVRQTFCVGTRTKNTSLRRAQNWVRISRPKIGKLACQAQGEDIFANGEIPYFLVCLKADLLRWHPHKEAISAQSADWVRIFGAERVKLACTRQAKRYSPWAKFPIIIEKERQDLCGLPFFCY